MDNSKKEYVILLHGLSRNSLSMVHLTVPLRQRGYVPYALTYRSRKQDLEESTRVVFEHLQKNVPPDATVHFITHSLGGLIVRKLVTSFPPHGAIRRVVMLSPPNQGAQVAEFARSVPPLRSFLGPVLNDLCNPSLPRVPDSVEIGIIAGGMGNRYGVIPLHGCDNDGMVCVRETRLDEAKDTLVMPSTHAFIMFNPRIYRQAFYFLENGEFDRSGIGPRAN